MSPTPDAYDEQGEPLYLQDTLTVCPAAHIERGREIALYYFQTVCGRSGMTLANMFTKGIAPTGESSPTHYICPRRIYQKDIDLQLATQQQFADGGDSFVVPTLIQPDSPSAVTAFCLVASDLSSFLSSHGMQEVNE